MLKHQVVRSSQIYSVAYDDATRVLEIQFRNRGKDADPASGPRYQYDDVPRSVYDEFMIAASLGIFFGARIKSEFATFKIQDGQRVALKNVRASNASRDYLAALLRKAGMIGDTSERVSLMLRPVLTILGQTVEQFERGTVDEWIGGLSQEQASRAIEFVKGRAG